MNQPKTNVLVFFCDQFRSDIIGCYGGKTVRTPNIDALAAESCIFENAYTPTAICSPARASLMTGVYPHIHHMFNNSSPKYSYCEHLRPDMPMICNWAKEHTNYETAYFGKWHIGPAEDLFASAFDHTHHPDDSDLPFLNSSHWHPGTNLGPLVQSFVNGRAGTLDVPMDGFPDVAAANYTRQFLRARNSDSPFLAFCAFPGPHSPWMVPEEFGIRYDPTDIPVWENRGDTFEGKPINQRKLAAMERYKKHRSYLKSDRELQELLACCFSYVELIDEQIGRVVSDLRDLGLYDNTTIIFTADHGDMAGSHGFISKGGYSYDETYRIPMVIKPAGKPGTAAAPGRRISEPVDLIDVTATIADQMAGKRVRDFGNVEIQGDSLEPLMTGDASGWRKIHFAEFHGDWYGHYSIRSVTDGKWKLAWNFSDLCELYHLEEDPLELSNLFYDPKHSETRDRYMALLVERAAELDDGQVPKFMPELEYVSPCSES